MEWLRWRLHVYSLRIAPIDHVDIFGLHGHLQVDVFDLFEWVGW